MSKGLTIQILTMSVSKEFEEMVVQQLSAFGDYRMRKMFGGIGMFKDDIMFGMITSKDQLYFRTDPINVGDYEAAGMQSFYHEKSKGGMPYYEVPPEIFNAPDKLAQWAQAAFLAAERAKKK